MELQTGRNTAWRPYQPPQPATQPLAYHVMPRHQTLLAHLHPASAQSFADMTCVLLWAGPTYAGALPSAHEAYHNRARSKKLALQLHNSVQFLHVQMRVLQNLLLADFY